MPGCAWEKEGGEHLLSEGMELGERWDVQAAADRTNLFGRRCQDWGAAEREVHQPTPQMERDAPGWEKFLLNPITQEGDALFQLLLRIDFVYPSPQIP